jgi:hypothetical protein
LATDAVVKAGKPIEEVLCFSFYKQILKKVSTAAAENMRDRSPRSTIDFIA